MIRSIKEMFDDLDHHVADLTDSQLEWIVRFQDAYGEKGRLSDRQLEVLTGIHEKVCGEEE